jgi:hypothetical protein
MSHILSDKERPHMPDAYIRHVRDNDWGKVYGPDRGVPSSSTGGVSLGRVPNVSFPSSTPSSSSSNAGSWTSPDPPSFWESGVGKGLVVGAQVAGAAVVLPFAIGLACSALEAIFGEDDSEEDPDDD